MFHEELARCLGYVRQYVACQVLFHLFEEGIFDALLERPTTAGDLATRLALRAELVSDLLEYGRIEGIVVRDGEAYRLSLPAERLSPFRGWLRFFVGGYGDTFRRLGDSLHENAPPPPRDFRLISLGSCEISRFGALPLTKALLARAPAERSLVMDVGCGTGLYLAALCEEMPEWSGVGLDAQESSLAAARAYVEAKGLSDRIVLRQGTAQDIFRDYDGPSPDVLIFAFVLHEILGQSGQGALLELLRSARRLFPQAHTIIVETDHAPEDEERMSSAIGKGYYNPYYLTQAFTRQVLRPRAYWKQLAEEIGFRLVAEQIIDPEVDPGGLEFGLLLAHSPREGVG